MIGKDNISARNVNQRVGDGSLRQGLRLTFSAVVALAGAFLIGRMAADVVLGQLPPILTRALVAEQIAGLILLGLVTLLVLVRLDHTCGICSAFQMALVWLQRGEAEENG